MFDNKSYQSMKIVNLNVIYTIYMKNEREGKKIRENKKKLQQLDLSLNITDHYAYSTKVICR